MGGAPLSDLAVVAREEDVGDFHATKVGGLGVLREFNIVAVAERFDGGRFGTTEYSRQ